MKMTKKERIQAAIKGEKVDRLPVAFWRHWPGDDQDAGSMAAAALDYQKKFDLDFIKLPVSSTYTVSDYGVKHAYQGSLNGDRAYLERTIFCEADWAKIEALDINKGTYGWHLEALSKIIKNKEEDTPVIVTMFNPLSIAAYLAGDGICLANLRAFPSLVEPALEALTETSVRFAKACLERGADGIFLSTRFASYEKMSLEEYNLFGKSGDLAVLKAAEEAWFNVLHLHGQFPMLPPLANYPVHALNWHDRTTPYCLAEAAGYFKGALMGGVEQYRVLHFGKPEEVKEQVEDASRQMNGRRLIISPGCTYPVDVPQVNLMALRSAVDS